MYVFLMVLQMLCFREPTFAQQLHFLAKTLMTKQESSGYYICLTEQSPERVASMTALCALSLLLSFLFFFNPV